MNLPDTGVLPGSLVELALSNSRTVSRFGARLVVLCKFVDATSPQLTVAQRLEAARMLRDGVESAMAMTDDIAMPGEYHATLLEQTNLLLNALNVDRRV